MLIFCQTTRKNAATTFNSICGNWAAISWNENDLLQIHFMILPIFRNNRPSYLHYKYMPFFLIAKIVYMPLEFKLRSFSFRLLLPAKKNDQFQFYSCKLSLWPFIIIFSKAKEGEMEETVNSKSFTTTRKLVYPNTHNKETIGHCFAFWM